MSRCLRSCGSSLRGYRRPPPTSIQRLSGNGAGGERGTTLWVHRANCSGGCPEQFATGLSTCNGLIPGSLPMLAVSELRPRPLKVTHESPSDRYRCSRYISWLYGDRVLARGITRRAAGGTPVQELDLRFQRREVRPDLLSRGGARRCASGSCSAPPCGRRRPASHGSLPPWR
jgi:hypothetical protein